MPVSRQQIESALTSLLEPESFRDYCPNGLQVEGAEQISKLVTGVTASQALIDAAIATGADSILVHHGYFWKGEDQAVVGMKRRRLAALLAANINLFAYHLPLDAHPELGNNAQLARILDFEVKSVVGDPALVFIGTCAPMSHAEMLGHLEDRLEREPLGIEGRAEQIERVAWCTGAAQGYIETALLAGADAFITGEVSEQTFHFARETGMHFFSAGHHATERYGVQAVGDQLATQFGVEHRFIDIDNPV
ncbi:MAG: Nif3-like dinuclear metal center hexameric protein [Pseudohongiellaceae bacterium]|jgi:dinuclear metal center YbgI/SA1388 family protein